MENKKDTLIEKIVELMNNEARSCSMNPLAMTAEYVARMWGGTVAVDDIAQVLEEAKKQWRG